jgi:hypothetical protein
METLTAQTSVRLLDREMAQILWRALMLAGIGITFWTEGGFRATCLITNFLFPPPSLLQTLKQWLIVFLSDSNYTK